VPVDLHEATTVRLTLLYPALPAKFATVFGEDDIRDQIADIPAGSTRQVVYDELNVIVPFRMTRKGVANPRPRSTRPGGRGW